MALGLMTAALSDEVLRRLAGRKPIDSAHQDAGEQLVWIKRLSRSLPTVEWHIIENGKSGMASYVEALIGPPSNAIALRKSLWAPLAAIGGGSYLPCGPGEMTASTPLTLMTIDEYEPALEPIAEAIRANLRGRRHTPDVS
jgi:hypothetical protein